MPTLIGVVFLGLALYGFLFDEERLLGLLMIAAVFEASSAINFGTRGVQPYYIVAGFIIARATANRLLKVEKGRKAPLGWLISIFGVVAVASAVVFPIVFAGIPVYDPKIGIDDGFFVRPPLAFGLNNVGQAGFLAVHITTVFSVVALSFSAKKTYRAYLSAFYLVLFFVVAQIACQRLGFTFPDAAIRNNPGYALSDLTMLGESGARNPGTYSEPSYAGAFFVFYCIGFIAQYLSVQGGALRVMIALLASVMVASSTSLLVLALFIPLLMLVYTPVRFPWHVNLRRAKRLLLIALLIGAPVLLALLSSAEYRELLLTLTVAKGETSSFLNRTTADLFAFQLLVASHWLGVGLGSNRASSLIATLLSNVGVAGALTFFGFYLGVLWKLPKRLAWLRWGAAALLANVCIGIADVTSPILWTPILFSVCQIAQERVVGSVPEALERLGHADAPA